MSLSLCHTAEPMWFSFKKKLLIGQKNGFDYFW